MTTPYVFFSYVRWRGWLPYNRLQACGGGWGRPLDAMRDLENPNLNCQSTEGPFHRGTGLLTCMSRPLLIELSRNDDFLSFLYVSKSRNDFGTPCNTVKQCSQQPFATHMWHHEDAGIMSALKRLNVAIVHMPERGWVFPWVRDYSLLSKKTLLIHKFKASELGPLLDGWDINEAFPKIEIDCSQSCEQWGWMSPVLLAMLTKNQKVPSLCTSNLGMAQCVILKISTNAVS